MSTLGKTLLSTPAFCKISPFCRSRSLARNLSSDEPGSVLALGQDAQAQHLRKVEAIPFVRVESVARTGVSFTEGSSTTVQDCGFETNAFPLAGNRMAAAFTVSVSGSITVTGSKFRHPSPCRCTIKLSSTMASVVAGALLQTPLCMKALGITASRASEK